MDEKTKDDLIWEYIQALRLIDASVASFNEDKKELKIKFRKALSKEMVSVVDKVYSLMKAGGDIDTMKEIHDMIDGKVKKGG